MKPKVLHVGAPCEKLSRLGEQTPSSEDLALAEFSCDLLSHQEKANPVGSLLFSLELFVKRFGTLVEPRRPWAMVRTDSCQYNMTSLDVSDGSFGNPVEKGQIWVSNSDLSGFSLRCRKPDALLRTLHQHRQIRGSMKIREDNEPGLGPKWAGAGKLSGIYPEELCESYWVSLGPTSKQLEVKKCHGDEPLSEWLKEPQQFGCSMPVGSSVFAVHPRSAGSEESAEPRLHANAAAASPEADVLTGGEWESVTAAERERLEAELLKFSEEMRIHWDGLAKKGEWDSVKSDLSVYRLSGSKVTEDPRRTPEYREQVVEGLHFGKTAEAKRPYLSKDDLEACKDVVSRKAAAFWVEGTPRTTIQGVSHDCIPTGAPVSSQPHALRGEAAAWVDEQLESEVARGQLVRGSSPSGSAPFPTKEAPEHKKQRKRRLVVDYRRVNARLKRSTYYCRQASDVLACAAGSAWFSFVDAVTGFNQVANTRRAMEVLAIVSRSGKFLPLCLAQQWTR